VANELEGKVAIITGAAGGIGSATSSVLAEAGARVVLADLPGTPVEEVAASLRSAGLEAISKECDVTDAADVQALIRAATDTFGGIDVLDNNAGATSFHGVDTTITDLDPEVWDRIIAINSRGPMLACKYAIPVMIEGGGGAIVNISSGKSLAGDLDDVAYAAGKSALNSLTRYVAATYGKQGIRCNAVAPGIILSPMARATLPAPILAVMEANTLTPRLGEPEDIARAVLFLASEASSYVTGQILSVDGGHSSHQPHLAQFRELLGAEGGAG